MPPYTGLVIGESDFSVDDRYGMSVCQGPQTRPPFATDRNSATAIEYRLGVEYSFNEQFGAFIEYSRTDVDDIEFSRRGGAGGLATTTQSGDFDVDSINLGLNFRF